MTNPANPIARRGRIALLPRGYAARGALAAGLLLAGGVAFVGPDRLLAQIEGERGIAPVVASNDIEIGNIEVDATGKNAQDAKLNGWREAYKKAWEAAHGPALDAGTIESIVAGVVVEREEIGPHRYRAKLVVAFDRGRAGQYGAGNGGVAVRSAPMLVIPMLTSGGVSQVFEVRSPWQKVWAEYRTGASAIDYVRANGGGADSLIINAGQPGRRSRVWWRGVLDQFGASDVLIPAARLERQWPGGPVKGFFTARYGPDNIALGSFELTASDDGAVPAMLAQALARMDQIYTDALSRGLLRPDPTLSVDHPTMEPGLASLIAAGRAAEAAAAAQAAAERAADEAAAAEAVVAAPAPPQPKPGAAALTIQFASPDARAVDQALAAVRGVAGVDNAATTSIAIGGTSVMRAQFNGNADALAAALRKAGWQVSVAGAALRIRR
ncbi:heavy-metal-associated domain-containing protein [Novosphingobium sp. KACC 22771]|uniref:heavy-metal-associated domain-containing protein n=1 Tax=Novosphingobium sp. KACC 22771 TaxID=3025670 RepID=UPI00236693F3|nr:heavy-metal-associated domain-containing protein [Novosphingobium sp. KACC 22771]WDF71120.1 heavy-metal-associated domain-containing protein [Novosphingobium sp. KACC 22771]